MLTGVCWFPVVFAEAAHRLSDVQVCAERGHPHGRCVRARFRPPHGRHLFPGHQQGDSLANLLQLALIRSMIR